MDELKSLYLTALKSVTWQKPEHFSFRDEHSKQWLLESGSLSRLLAERCNKLDVDLLNNSTIDTDHLTGDELQRLPAESYLLREVVLSGDSTPWVIGRTLIPTSSLEGQQSDLARQGTIPLGLTVFSAENVHRDGLELGWAKLPNGELMARRSTLWMNHKPMLVAELFLPDAPIYTKEKV
ncbi:chorismate lyase [Vibrio nigripulchritudo]|uniref:chorismate lyase n=1 Tax=Vibrio nigripulchritudo TaxID=28173 RepID=UPI0005FA0720|nr:chorismate lyase [Vibrio nigripulchritudo]KJY67292.1 chorismate--pyruvate lyase [Vibrio nigripulchritudo]